MDIGQMRKRLQKDIAQLRAPLGFLYAGHPNFHTLFGRDSIISAWQMLEIEPSIAKATLTILAALQGKSMNPTKEEEPGKILHEHRFDAESRRHLPHWEFPYYGSVDSTPLFVYLAGHYAEQTRDDGFIRELWPSVLAGYKWVTGCADAGGGYLRYERRNPYGLFHQGWKDGSEDHLKIRPPVAIVEAQGYAFAAYRALAELAIRLGSPTLADDASERARVLRDRFNRDFWVPGGFLALALDGSGVPREVATSNPGHLLFTGILPPDRATETVARLFRADLWTPYGIRTHSTSAADFNPYGYHTGTVWPHDNWIIAEGLRRSGFDREAGRITDALIAAYDEIGKIPELYAVVDERLVDLSESPMGATRANPLQAWASAGLLALLQNR
jgi:glycogen debranching enzyme